MIDSLYTFAPMKKSPVARFKDFLQFFPEIELPVELTDEYLHIFNRENKPFSQSILEQFIYPLEKEQIDDMTEFVPCFKIPETVSFDAVVYWKASLLRHEYIIASFNNKGELIARKSIAGMISDGMKITKSVAQIDADWLITIIVGESIDKGITFDPQKSQAMNMELLATGDIIFSLQDKDY